MVRRRARNVLLQDTYDASHLYKIAPFPDGTTYNRHNEPPTTASSESKLKIVGPQACRPARAGVPERDAKEQRARCGCSWHGPGEPKSPPVQRSMPLAFSGFDGQRPCPRTRPGSHPSSKAGQCFQRIDQCRSTHAPRRGATTGVILAQDPTDI
jgi:hypothetical protein